MTLEEAIEELRQLNLPIKTKEDYRKHQAVRLAIEALKRIKKSRGEASRYYIGYLPGETESPS